MLAVLITPHLSFRVIHSFLVSRGVHPPQSSLLFGDVPPQLGIVDIFLGNETRLGPSLLIKRLAFEVGDDFVDDGPAHRVGILSYRRVLGTLANAIERQRCAVKTNHRNVSFLSERGKPLDLAQ